MIGSIVSPIKTVKVGEFVKQGKRNLAGSYSLAGEDSSEKSLTDPKFLVAAAGIAALLYFAMKK